MIKCRLIILGVSALVISLFSLSMCSQSDTSDFDILVLNGKIVDGTGNPWFYGDIGITADSIVAIGNLSGKAALITIDAEGLVVSPGFIDMHTHCERGLENPESKVNLNYLTQGVTTVVTGNCGSGPFKIAEAKAKLENQGMGTNAVPLVGHGDVRRAVMGVEPRESTPEELLEMQILIRQAMKEGAWGMSTGLEYIPGRYSNTEEVITLTKVVGEFDGIYSSHQRNECDNVPEGTKETIRIAEETGVRVNPSHLKVCGKNNWGDMREVVSLINDARARGISITVDMYPYHKAASGPLSGYIGIPKDMEPLVSLRKKMRDQNLSDMERERIREQYGNELVKALSDKSKWERIKEATNVGFPHEPSRQAMWGWDSFTIVTAKKNTHLIDKILSDLAQEQKRDAFDIIAELYIEEKDDIRLSDGAMSEDEMKLAMKEDWLMFSSDGGALAFDPERPVHPRNYGSFPRVLRKYVREEGLLTLEEAVRKMASLPASLLQMKDRGLLMQGYKADIVIFDSNTVKDIATHVDSHQYSTGIEYVMVNGKLSIEEGQYNDSLNGKVLLLTEN